MRQALRRHRTLAALLALTGVALAARLFRLGARVAHQDEARVAHWILHYMSVGQWEYRAIIHGPLLPHVNGVIFSVLGPSDFTMRLVVAVVGGLLPLTAWLLRDHLRSSEVVVLGALFAANPLLLYYSRFMRNDLLLAGLAFLTFALIVRARDTGRARYLHVAAVAFGVAAASKENVLLYPLCWGGALALLLDHRLYLARHRDVPAGTIAITAVRKALRGLYRIRLHVFLCLVELAVVVIAFYAPKPELYHALANPSMLPGVVESATLGSWDKFLKLWGSASMHEHSYPEFLGFFLLILGAGAATLTLFGFGGFLLDRYASDRPRDLVAFTFYWSFASLLGYPAATDIQAPWAVIHVVVPLAVPAAVGLAFVYRTGRRAITRDDRRISAVAAVVLLLAASASVGAAVTTSYAAPQHPDNPLVQYAQPAGDMKPTLNQIERISATNDGIDVTFYGSEFHNPGDARGDESLDIETGGYPGWFARLPLPWYFERYGTSVSSTTAASDFESNPPPVVITLEKNTDEVSPHLEGYSQVTHQGYLWGRPIVFFVDESRLPA